MMMFLRGKPVIAPDDVSLPVFLPGLDATPWPLRLARRVGQRLAGGVRWFTARPERVLVLVWLLALMVVGNGVAASADQILSPHLHGPQPTLFEKYGFLHY
jgi:hypothetical protein